MRSDRGSRALVVVAHPDDEVIFLGGILLRLREVGWSTDVVCATGRFATATLTSVRRAELRRAARSLGSTSVTLDLADRPGPLPLEGLTDRLTERIDLSSYDSVFTHGVWGEYGHRHHIDVSTVVHRNVAGAWSLAGPLAAARTVRLGGATLARKRALARELYPSQAFASSWCSSTERLVRINPSRLELLRLVAGAAGAGEERELARLAPLEPALAALARRALDALETTPPFPELANIPQAIWEPARALWRTRLRALLGSSDRLDEELRPARAHPAGRLGPTGKECA